MAEIEGGAELLKEKIRERTIGGPIGLEHNSAVMHAYDTTITTKTAL